MGELGILHFRVIPGKKWSCVNSVVLILVNILWLLEAQLLTSCVRLIVQVSSDIRVFLLDLADNCSGGAELAFCPAMCWGFGSLLCTQCPIFPGGLRRQELILVRMAFICSAKGQLLQGLFSIQKIWSEAVQFSWQIWPITAWIKGSGVFGCWGQFSICEREQIVAAGSEVPCLLHRSSTSFADLLHLEESRPAATG